MHPYLMSHPARVIFFALFKDFVMMRRGTWRKTEPPHPRGDGDFTVVQPTISPPPSIVCNGEFSQEALFRDECFLYPAHIFFPCLDLTCFWLDMRF